jgi:chromosome segregation ATPase
VAFDARRSESVAKSDLSKLRKDLKEKLGLLHQRIDGLAVNAAEDQRSALEGLDEAVASMRAELETQRQVIGDRVEETERETASLRGQLTQLRESAAERMEAQEGAESDLLERVEELASALGTGASAQADLAAAVAEVRAELSMLSTRVDAPDVAMSNAVEALREEVAEVADLVRSSRAGPDRTQELHARIDELERRLERENEPVEEVSEGVAEDDAAQEPQPDPGAAFLAFVPLDQGYSLQELVGAPPLVGEPLTVADGAGEFVVTRIGRSPLPLDRRQCVYLEPAVLESPSDRVT